MPPPPKKNAYCDTVTYNKKNTYLVFLSFLGRALKPLESPNVESCKGVFCYANEVTFGKHLSIGAVCQKSQGINICT